MTPGRRHGLSVQPLLAIVRGSAARCPRALSLLGCDLAEVWWRPRHSVGLPRETLARSQASGPGASEALLHH